MFIRYVNLSFFRLLFDSFIGYVLLYGTCVNNPTSIPSSIPSTSPTTIPTYVPSIFPTSSPTYTHIYTSNIQVTTIIGSGGAGNIDGTGILAQIKQPHDIHVDQLRNIMYIASYGNKNVRRVNMATLATSTIANRFTFNNGVTSCSITSAGDLYVTIESQLVLILLVNQQNVTQLI